MKVYIVRAEINENSCFASFPDFETEVFSDKNVAENRLKYLKKNKKPYCGFYFTMDEAELDMMDESY